MRFILKELENYNLKNCFVWFKHLVMLTSILNDAEGTLYFPINILKNVNDIT